MLEQSFLFINVTRALKMDDSLWFDENSSLLVTLVLSEL
ncbi:hypothetical protein D046_1153 [Vibrio parahaemolyticus V-223/04]|nr:hypothetical protein D046_1153 [Vibrio parahaemolyticus V-223/04]